MTITNPSPSPPTGATPPGSADDDLAVVTRDVRRSFGGRPVLQGIDLRLRPGEFVALLGRSGSGKSTLLRALAGLDHDTEGQIVVPERRSVVFQDPRLLPWATVLDNVVLGLDHADAETRGRDALVEVGLAGHEDDWPKTLSGGEAQRAALARALVRAPALLLLDEPFGALDALTRIKMQALVQHLWARHHPAVLLVTHDVEEALLLADRVLVLTDGVISLDVPVDIPTPRRRSDPRFLELRPLLLAELGVAEDPDAEAVLEAEANDDAHLDDVAAPLDQPPSADQIPPTDPTPST